MTWVLIAGVAPGAGSTEQAFSHALGRVFTGGSPSRLHSPRLAWDGAFRLLGSVNVLPQPYSPEAGSRNHLSARPTGWNGDSAARLADLAEVTGNVDEDRDRGVDVVFIAPIHPSHHAPRLGDAITQLLHKVAVYSSPDTGPSCQASDQATVPNSLPAISDRSTSREYARWLTWAGIEAQKEETGRDAALAEMVASVSKRDVPLSR